MLVAKRRTPIEKVTKGIPEPGHIRPIDVFSTLLRLYSSCACALLRPWILQVAHPTQTATHGGILHSVTSMAFWTECVLNNVRPIYAFSLDLSMMFNMLSPTIAGKLAEAAGLNEGVVNLLTWPLIASKSVWRLPHNMTNPSMTAERGLPQGLATSVLLAEVIVSALVHKLHMCAHCATIVYVDDINVITHTLDAARRCLEVVLDFVHSLHLSLSIAKSALWGTDQDGLEQLKSFSGIKPTSHLEAFGASWQLREGRGYVYRKEHARMLRVRERLLRVKHLPAHPSVRAAVASTTALSPLDYISVPVKGPLHSLRTHVRAAIGARHGAPEIVYNLPTSGLLDPVDRGLVSLLRLWINAYNTPEFREVLLSGQLECEQGRLAAVRRECASRGILIHEDTITFGPHREAPSFRIWAGWNALRKPIIRAIKDLHFVVLQARRPAKFGGDVRCAWNVMKREYARATPYDAAVLLKIWSGAIMTASHRHTMDPDHSPDCRCGEAEETLAHLMWDCPLHARDRPVDLRWWNDLPPANAMSLILPHDAGGILTSQWRRVCRWAIMCVTKRTQQEHDDPGDMVHGSDITHEENGHCVITREDIAYCWCARCFITRKVRDRHFLTMKPCKKQDHPPAPEGHYIVREGHCARIVLVPWKLHSWRPRAVCQKCRAEQWATAPFRRQCMGE